MKKRFKEHVQGGGRLNFRSYRTQPQDLPQNPKWDLEADEQEQETLESAGEEMDEADKPKEKPLKKERPEKELKEIEGELPKNFPTRKVRRQWSQELRDLPPHSEEPHLQAAEKYLRSINPNYDIEKRYKQSAQNARDFVDQLRSAKEAGQVDEVAPPGWEGTVKAMKKHDSIDNPWALAWWLRKQGAHPHKVGEALSRLQGRASIERLLLEYDDMTPPHHVNAEHSEALETEHELKKAVSDANVHGVGVHIAETGLSHETIIVSIDGQEALDMEFHMLVTCTGDGTYDANLFVSGEDGSRPLNVDRDLDLAQLKSRVLEFCESVHELIASKKLEVPANEIDEERTIKPKQPRHGQVSEIQKRATMKILDDMVQARMDRPVSHLKENLERTRKILRG